MAAATAVEILRYATSFLDEALAQPDNRLRILSSASRRPASADPATIEAFTLFTDAISSPHSSPSPARSSTASLRSAEKLLLTVPCPNPLSALLHSLIHALRRRPIPAAVSLLDIFAIDPFAARQEIAPFLFEDLFIPHLIPLLQWFTEERSRILASSFAGEGDNGSSAMRILSRMSGGQAAELKKLQMGYEEVIDANSRVYAQYLKQVLEASDGFREAPGPPQLIQMEINGGGEGIDSADREIGDEEEVEEEKERGKLGLRTGRYNPMWDKADQAIDLSSKNSSKEKINYTRYPTLFPERVSPHLLIQQPSNDGSDVSTSHVSDSGRASYSDDNSEDSYSEFDPDIEKNNMKEPSFQLPNQIKKHRKNQSSAGGMRSSDSPMVDSDSIHASSTPTPPKDFVCPITSQLFEDPVTLETGQTYERRAIQEWLDRGYSTCPITRQTLHSTQLPKTNYVLKRLIATWKEQNPCLIPSYDCLSPKNVTDPMNSPSPTNVIVKAPTSVTVKASSDGKTGDLRLVISRLCTSEILGESEMAVLQIEKFWREASTEPEILSSLSKPAVVNGFVEILFNSVNPQVLGATIFLLSELASKDKFVIQTLTRVDSDVECMVALFKKGLVEAVVLIYLLSPSLEILIEMNMIETLAMTIQRRDEGTFEMCMKPKTASILLLNQIFRGDPYLSESAVAGALNSGRVVENVIPSLQSDLVEERIAAVGILQRCMEVEGNCRNAIANKAELSSILEIFAMVSDEERFEIVRFLSELVKLKRRTFNEQVLHIIKDEGAFSTMHTLLVYLQIAPQDQIPIVASLLLQLDLLVEPRKMSMYREEAIDALISCLRNREFPSSRLLAAETILALQGRFSSSGKPLALAFLLKRAGMNKSYRALMREESMSFSLADSEEDLEEEKAANEWERKMAYSLVSHEFGLLFEALAEGLKSKSVDLCSTCLASAAWLTHMLSILPDTGLRGAARVCLLKQFVMILKSSTDANDKALSVLALRSFMHDHEGVHDITLHIKDVLKVLRELKKSSVLAYEMLKLLTDGKESSIQDMWNHKELMQVDCSSHGEVLSVIYFNDRIFSGHSDGTIKVWGGGENLLHLVQETREHSKAVTSLAILQSGNKLYSGSLDKSVRIWSVQEGRIQCTEIYDMKDQVHNLSVANTIICFIPSGAGIKVLSLNGGSKLLNPNKYVRCLALVHGKLYCGCNDSSIQEIDLATGTVGTIQPGNRKLLSKANPIYAMQVHEGLLYSAGTSLDGASVKIWSVVNYGLVGSLPSTLDVRSMTVSSELIYLGCKLGTVEIWSREKLTRVGSLQTGKVLTMAVDNDGEVLVVGTSDGKIQAWGLT